MKSVSIINQPGGTSSRYEGDTRIVGFRVECSEIVKSKGEKYFVTNPDIIEDLSIEYLTKLGYRVEKV